MAVVQISRIQVRRGKAEAGTGVPQLASGEFGWAVDTRELYIGNGSVSEGAPQVGNTRILTQFSDILGEAAKYAYRQGEITTGASGNIERTLQSKLDDIVNVRDFGANGDGLNQTEALQRAINQLFLNTDRERYESHVTLYMPAGEYKIDNTLYIPPFTRIVGDGKGATYIYCTGEYAFRTVNWDHTPGNPIDPSTTDTSNQPKNILLKGMTIVDTTRFGTLILDNTKDSIFQDIEFEGQFDPSTDNPYVNGVDDSGGWIDFSAIKLNINGQASVPCVNNKFINCSFNKFVFPVYSDDDIATNTWDQCVFDNSVFGIAFGFETLPAANTPGRLQGPSDNSIINSTFDNIYKEAIVVKEGVDNLSQFNRFYNVGNEGGTSATASTAVIRFGYQSNVASSEARYDPRFHVGNKSIGDYFQRTEELTVNSAYNTGDYPPEVEGAKFLTLDNEIQTRLGSSSNVTVAIVDVSQSDPIRIRTFTPHNLENSQQVLLTGMTGMTEINGRTFYVQVVDDDEFDLYQDEGLTSSEDGTSYTPYGSGGAVVGAVRTYFMQLPADQRRGTILVDYIYDATISNNEINRKGTLKFIYDLDNNLLSFNEDYTATGNIFYAELLNFTASLDASNYKITVSFTNTGFSVGSDKDNFRFTIKHNV